MKFFSVELEFPETKAMSINTNLQVEKWSGFIHSLILKILCPAFMLPKFFVSLFVYFTTDTGNDTLELPFPMS